jgi:hypothetical protein
LAEAVHFWRKGLFRGVRDCPDCQELNIGVLCDERDSGRFHVNKIGVGFLAKPSLLFFGSED